MIEDKRIIDDAKIAIDRLNSIIVCLERDGFVSEDYVYEKANCAKHCIDFILSFTDLESESD